MTTTYHDAASSRPRLRYTGAQRLLHWAMALVIIAALGLGLYCAYLGHGSPQRELLMTIHKSLGMTALVLIVLRIPIRVTSGEPGWKATPGRATRIASHAAHGILYLLMLLMPLSGYITSTSEGRTVPWFGLFTWPDLLAEDKPFGRMVGTVHKYGAYAFFTILGLHLLAVIWHRFVKRDEVLSRML
ncbi:cytochrome b [Neorhizobium sp. NCHU2750]|uniref:cytochrome b n=1 Tax=Neorhizobium sp. NCHU2750 TaxID=1825976 RepID=UPI000E7248D5|nr:cytochrome B561 [Neorhizobium sp. NCHU2750]